MNLRRIYVKPVDRDRVVINPETNRPIPLEGELVLDNKYFRRRVAENDVIVVDAPTATAIGAALSKSKSAKTAQKED